MRTPLRLLTSRRARLERRLSEVWSTVLNVGDVGPDDDFFELGGTSLQAMQIIGLTEETFGVLLSVSSVLEARTVAEMARHVRQALAEVS
jgi:phthiocerol/phenolphthiocerol synthesis type-I polyketide synthase E